MSLMVCATGLAGFLASFSLLHLGLTRMWMRYGVSVLCAYAVFLFLVWLWVLYHREHQAFDVSPMDAVDLVDVVSAFGQNGGQPIPESMALPAEDPSPSGGMGFSFDVDEFIVVLALIAAVGSALIASAYVISTAPALLGEVLVDGVLSVGLYRRLKKIDERHWLESAVMRTGFPIVAVFAFFAVAGAVLQSYAPEAVSIAGVWQHYQALN